jgi:hypothetical protein
LIVTSTCWPVSRFVTRARVPKGNERWASVRACGEKRSPLAVAKLATTSFTSVGNEADRVGSA